MSSPRKFAEKIALIQQKQAEGDAAFNTILFEVEAAKQRGDQGPTTTTKTKSDVSKRKHEKSSEGANGLRKADGNNYSHQSIKMETNNGIDFLLQPPDNLSWRRTHSDSSLHYAMMPTVAAHYHARVNHDDYDQQLSYDVNDIEFDLSPFTGHQQQQQQHQHQFQPQEQPLEQQPFQAQYPYDFNNNHHYPQEQINMMHPLSQIPMPQQQQQPTTTAPSSSHNHSHTPLGPRYSGGNSSSNVLMLPPNQNPRGGGSLPDLRMGDMNHHHHHHQVSYSTTPSPPSSATQRLFRSPSSEQNNEADLFIWSPQQRLPSNIGPLKQSPSVHRRHSPIADGRPSSPRRQNSPSPDVSPSHHTMYRGEPSSPQSQSSYSPQHSPRLLPNPNNDHNAFSPQSSTDNQQQNYCTLPTQFDQITLDSNNFYSQSAQQPCSSPQQNHGPATSGIAHDDHSTYLQQANFYAPFIDNLPSPYGRTQPIGNLTNNSNQKSPTIPNIILTDADSSKLDLSKDLAHDFPDPFDSLIDLQLNTDDFLLHEGDLSVDPTACDDAFRMDR